MPLLLGASEVTADCKVGLRSSWWNTAQDFSQVKGKWISLALLFSAKLVQKTQLSQSRVTQRGAQPAGFVRPPSAWNTRQSKIYTHPNSTCECRLKKTRFSSLSWCTGTLLASRLLNIWDGSRRWVTGRLKRFLQWFWRHLVSECIDWWLKS